MAVCHSLMIAAMCCSLVPAACVLPQSKRDSPPQRLHTVVPGLKKELMLSSDPTESLAFLFIF